MSARNMTAAMSAAIVAGTVRPVLFVEGSFYAAGSPDEEFIRFWSGIGEFSWDGKSWAGAGKVMRITAAEESRGLQANGFNVELSGLPQSVLSLALDNSRQGRAGRVWLGLIGNSGYLSLPGEPGDYASMLDSAAVSVTGDIDIRFKVELDDWTPVNEPVLCLKTNSANAAPYILQISAAGGAYFRWSADGVTVAGTVNRVLGVTDGATKRVRVTLDVDNGAGGWTVKVYLSDDGVAWTQVGADIVGAGTTSIFDSSGSLLVGGLSTGNVVNGKIYSAEIRNGIDGPIVASFDPANDAENGATSFVSSRTGETWTINQSGSPMAELVVTKNEIIADPYLIQSGRLDFINITANGEGTTITAQYENRLVDLQRPRERRYTDEDQRYEYPTDTGFRFVAGLQDKQLIWGGPGAASSPLAAPRASDAISNIGGSQHWYLDDAEPPSSDYDEMRDRNND